MYKYYKIMSFIVGLGMDKQFFRRKYSLTLDRTCQCHFLVYLLPKWHIYILEELEVALSYSEQKENPWVSNHLKKKKHRL